jgi:hypothetical protein
MPSSLIATTSDRDLNALGTGGRRSIDAAEALAALLGSQLSPAHAALFAEPQPDIARGEVNWYAEGSGPAEPFTRLPAEQAATVRAEADRLVADIRGLIQRLRAASQESNRFLAEMLAHAIRIPNPDALRMRNGRPVLVAWGHEQAGPSPVAMPILGQVREVPRVAAPAATPAAQPVPAPAALSVEAPLHMTILPPPMATRSVARHRWLWPGALAASLLLLACVLLFWFFLPILTRSEACRIPSDDAGTREAWQAADAQNTGLRGTLAALMDDAGRRRLRCSPADSAAVVAPTVTDTERSQQQGGHAGRLQIILAWDDRNDLDLHVLCPGGEHLFFRHPEACGGRLDVDANADQQPITETPVENMVWVDPSPGTYKVFVDPFKMRDRPQSTFRITIRQAGRPDRTQTGTAVEGQQDSPVFEVRIPPP